MEQIASNIRPIDIKVATLLANDEEQKNWMDRTFDYLKKARSEDDERYSKLFVTKNDVEVDKARKEGYAAGIATQIQQEEKKQVRLDNKLLILATILSGLVVYLCDHVKFNF